MDLHLDWLTEFCQKCTVSGIDSNELQGLDVVQCAALVQTNHGIAIMIMNEYACYGKGHTIHSSGQIEWFKTSVDDSSVQVGGKQRIWNGILLSWTIPTHLVMGSLHGQ